MPVRFKGTDLRPVLAEAAVNQCRVILVKDQGVYFLAERGEFGGDDFGEFFDPHDAVFALILSGEGDLEVSATATLPDGGAVQPRPWNDTPAPIQLALVRGHRWLEMVESGEARTLSEVAEREGMDWAYVSRMVGLTTLAPDIVAPILDETLPPEVILFDLASGTPLLWEVQRTIVNNQ